MEPLSTESIDKSLVGDPNREALLHNATDPYIAFSHVYKTFDRPVLVDVSFDLIAGETLDIIGRSGVG
jgi:hypothetical protein